MLGQAEGGTPGRSSQDHYRLLRPAHATRDRDPGQAGQGLVENWRPSQGRAAGGQNPSRESRCWVEHQEEVQ